MQEEITQYKKLIEGHKLCPKKKAKLVSAFNVLNNNYQFEVKKANMFDTNELDLIEKKEKVKKEKDEEQKNIKINSRSISYGNKIRKIKIII